MSWRIFALCLALALGTPSTAALAYPDRPVNVIVGGGPGSGIDLVVRALADTFEKMSGQKMVVHNRPGGLGRIAAYAARDAEPDGYTFGTITPGTLEAMRMGNDAEGYKRLDFLLGVATFPLLIVVKSGTVSSLQGLIESKPREYGHSNSIGKLGAEAFIDAVRIAPRPNPIYYTGKEPAMVADLLGGRIPFAAAIAPAVRGTIDAGTITALAVAAQSRAPFLRKVPTLSEALAHAGISSTEAVREPALGLVAPIGIDSDVRKRAELLIQRALEHPATQKMLLRLWAGPTTWDAQSFQAYALD